MVQLHDQIKSDDPQLSQTFEEKLGIQQEPSLDEKLTKEEPHDIMDDHDITSKSNN